MHVTLALARPALFRCSPHFWQAVYFYMFTITSVYICRVLRLAVGFSPKIRRAVPWLMSVRMCCHARIAFAALPCALVDLPTITVVDFCRGACCTYFEDRGLPPAILQCPRSSLKTRHGCRRAEIFPNTRSLAGCFAAAVVRQGVSGRVAITIGWSLADIVTVLVASIFGNHIW